MKREDGGILVDTPKVALQTRLAKPRPNLTTSFPTKLELSKAVDLKQFDEAKNAAAIIIQKYCRRYLAKRLAEKKLEEKRKYEERMEELSRQAYLQAVIKFREEQEKKREKEEEEEQKIRRSNMRKKRMLECAYEGRDVEMKALLKEVTDEDNHDGVPNDEIGSATRLRHKMQLVDCEDANGNTALSEACIGGYLDAVRFLLDNGAYINSRGQFGRTPLYRAAFGGHLEIVQVLLQNGADPRIYADDGMRPIDVTGEGGIRDLLENWDIKETDRLLNHIDFYRKQKEEQLLRGKEALLTKLRMNVSSRVKTYQMTQCKLHKAHEELNKRMAEYDEAKANGYGNMELLEHIIHDAEFYVESARLEMEKARKRCQEAKLELRDEEKKERRKSSNDSRPGIVCSLRDLDDVIFKDVGDRLSDSGKWPLIIDPTDQSSTFLRYRDTNYVNVLNPRQMDLEKIRIALLGALRYGKPFVLDLMELDTTFETLCRPRFEEISPGLLEDIVQKHIIQPIIYEDLIKPADGEEFSKTQFTQRNLDKFQFMVLTKDPFPPQGLLDQFTPVWVE
ncbi:unnamed protein product [Calicophoron daubneyi]|uniref:IQ motif and ankyrin repeat domain-containing protein n=1 Tax=Calicophoron daubneyi TaxID=300641 RepID=A0AAV2T6L7_CALDB